MTVADRVRAEEQLSEELSQYAGQWVATRDHKVVANAEQYEDLLEQIEGVEVEGVFQVLEEGLSCFF